MNQAIRILHLEDDPYDAELIRAKLAADGLSCDIVWADGKGAFESALAGQRFDVVLTDYNLPGYDGMSALARIRDERPELPVILLSGALGEEAAVECIKAGAADFVLKQQLQRLGAAVRGALERSRLAREAREAERELRESEARFRILTEMSSDFYWESDAEHRLTKRGSAARSSAASVFGRPTQIGERRWEIPYLSPDDAGWQAHRAALDAHRPFRDFVFSRLGSDGAERHLMISGDPVFDESGAFKGYRGVGTDITGRKQMELAVRNAELMYRAIFDHAVEGIFLVNAEGRVVSSNPMLARMLGYDSAEAMSREVGSVARQVYVERGARGRFRKLLDAQRMVENFETQWRRRDGSTFWVSLTGRMIGEETGGLIHHLGTARDITERKTQQDKIERLSRVYAISSGINAAIARIHERNDLFEEACRVAVEQGRFRMAWVGMLDGAAGRVTPVAVRGEGSDHLANIDITIGEGRGNYPLIEAALREKRHAVSNDMEHDSNVGPFVNRATEQGHRSVIVLPLVVDGRSIGIFVLYTGERNFFNVDEIELLRDLSGDLSFALEYFAKEEKLNYLVLYDPLTGLANRTLFQDRLSQYVHAAQQGQGKLALVLADVERFKTINDSLGRQAGDELLKQLAVRLGRAAGPGNIARIGGDHFAIVLPQMKGRSEIGRSVEAIWHDWFGQLFRVNDTELRIAARAGIAVFPNDGADAETLFSNAEAALRRAQETGERHAFHTRELTGSVAEQFTLENKLRQAFEQDEFVLHYQPKVDAETRRIVGVEALIRWQSPELGLVPPAQFIPLMEETGLILQVGSWALKQASLDHRKWVEQGLKAPRVAVNVSPIQLRQRDFVGAVEQAIMEGVAPTGIDLEITESLVMEDVQGNIEKLKSVRGLGVRIAIDDFGTGYSSLGYLAKLPVQSLKIDRSFIITMLDDADTMTLVSTIISLAHSLRLKVVAEGVDAEEQAKYLRLLRCDGMQGFLFSRPLPFDQMTALLQ
ncbi:MAG: EAL domain-containing protein [Betaproteobacteria bacterium]|nr:EAL domain-containing protein [Betaproteobacteria bacterium]